MTGPSFNRASHFSLVWAFVLAVLTLVEWRSLDRDPLAETIYLPFIERQVTLSKAAASPGQADPSTSARLRGDTAGNALQTTVQISFNGPLFLIYFAVPIVIFHGFGLLIARLRGAT
ncbi:hypothetical protein DWB85_10555 [Seongchinamella sediminis]|uniref:Uncharacterized protein n=1 Tax=Seongchinamella sediminis TaxID=2283635 RepID=A0A3L7DWN8_9GAMM|nr:hypothetical protein [Seongchinamella sediminis]RLQ21724.1 hypothetical protein DWB85_10555 [Seongchinamella sediminis]